LAKLCQQCKSQHHDITSILVSYFPKFNVSYEECSNWPSTLQGVTNSKSQFQIGNMHLSCSINPCLDSARKWQVIKYTKIVFANDYVGLRQAPSSQGDH
jgi:hypothetical protein